MRWVLPIAKTVQPRFEKGRVASGREAARAWLHGSSVLGALVSAGSTTVRKRLAAVKASAGLLAGVRPLVPFPGARMGEAQWAHGATRRASRQCGSARA